SHQERKLVEEAVDGGLDAMRLGREPLGHTSRAFPLVDFPTWKARREDVQGLRRSDRSDRGQDRRAVDAPAEARADGDVAAQAEPDRFVERVLHLVVGCGAVPAPGAL